MKFELAFDKAVTFKGNLPKLESRKILFSLLKAHELLENGSNNDAKAELESVFDTALAIMACDFITWGIADFKDYFVDF